VLSEQLFSAAGDLHDEKQNRIIIGGAIVHIKQLHSTYKYSVCEVTYHVVCHFVCDSVFLPEYKSNDIKKYYLFVLHFLPE